MNANVMGSGDIGEMITKMLSNPEELSKVMNMVNALSASGALGGISAETPGAKSGESDLPKGKEPPEEREEPSESAYARIKENSCRSRPKINQCDRIRLLEAMRPFLSEEKRLKLDTVIKLLGLAEAAGGLCALKR